MELALLAGVYFGGCFAANRLLTNKFLFYIDRADSRVWTTKKMFEIVLTISSFFGALFLPVHAKLRKRKKYLHLTHRKFSRQF